MSSQRSTRTRAAAGCAAAGLALAYGLSVTGAFATPPSVPGATPSDTVSGALTSTDKVQQDGVVLKTKQPSTVTTFDLTYPPGAYSGWHSHPGIVIAVVKQGSVIRQTPCSTETFEVGEAFTEVGSHFVRNASDSDPAVLSITRIYPSSATVGRLDQPEPECRSRD